MKCQNCENCYYGDVCPNERVCEGFDPITEEGEDELISELIERERKEYHEAWNTYIGEYND